jgi:hypothetical protein
MDAVHFLLAANCLFCYLWYRKIDVKSLESNYGEDPSELNEYLLTQGINQKEKLRIVLIVLLIGLVALLVIGFWP